MSNFWYFQYLTNCLIFVTEDDFNSNTNYGWALQKLFEDVKVGVFA